MKNLPCKKVSKIMSRAAPSGKTLHYVGLALMVNELLETQGTVSPLP
jgi:hypothetical protein